MPITGSDTVVVDLAEDGAHANIHLDADIKNKLDKALITPTSTPIATEIVAVDNTNSQKMLAIGDGLSVENGILKASGGSSNKLYKHFIHFSKTGANENKFTIVIVNNSQTTFDETSLKAYLYNNGFTSPNNYYPICANKGKSNNNEAVYIGIYSSDSTSYQFYFSTTEYTTDGSNITLSTTFSNGGLAGMGLAKDYVIEL